MYAERFHATTEFSASWDGLYIGEKYLSDTDWFWGNPVETTGFEEASAALIEDLVGTSDSEFATAVLDEWFRQWYVDEALPDVFINVNGVSYRFVFYVA